MIFLKYIAYISLSSTLLLSAPLTKKEIKLNAVIEMGKTSSKRLIKTLGKSMQKRLKKGGAMKALNFCSNEAYNLTQKVNKSLPNGVRVKRISSKFRSPANAPTQKELSILKSFQSLKDLDVVLPEYLLEKVSEHSYKYYKPLTINKKACLKCHGKVKDIELKREIARNYPIDNAMGYEMGDLRGAIVVTIQR